MKQVFAFVVFVLILSCSSDEDIITRVTDRPDPVVIHTGTYDLSHGGQNRTYHYYHPINLAENSPLVFVLHGYAANAGEFMDWLPMTELADKHGFAVVYPQGADDNSRRPHWNSDLTISTVDDVGFLSKLAVHLQETYSLDPERTFISGFSNGGFMSYEMAVKEPSIFKAAASIAGTMSGATWENRLMAEPISILQLSGQLDSTVPVSGLTTRIGGWDGAPPISVIVNYWAELNQADTHVVTDDDGIKVTKYTNSENDLQVWYYLLESLGHGIPGADNFNLDTPTLIWEFFSSN